MSFSPTQSALEGFRLVGRRPVSFAVWSLLIGLTMWAFFAGFLWVFVDFSRVIEGKPLGVEDLLPLAGRFLLFWLLGMIGMLVLFAVLMGGVLRATLKPTQRAFAYLRLGGAELRLIALQLVMFVILLLCEAAAAGAVAAVAYSSLAPGAKVLIGACLVVAFIAFVVIVLVRLSLAGPLIVARGRLDLSGAWALSRGRFWPLLGMGLLAYVLAMAVSTLAQIFIQPIFMTVMVPFGPAGASGWAHVPADPWSLVLAHPTLFAVLGVLAMPVFALQVVVQATPFAAAYKALSAQSETLP
jgi:hypothetical protein